ncbi:putative oxidoreductase [Mycobacterium xenopi 4042]|uniref:Putative oxidoreductase n=1 Tax=Mycobacterium xenopi 4042 TaxID=1299334 RepID=X7ZVN4_MYCXE|nr:putative oxidoreductase [Mycobacterium xenopi 4042]
MARRLVDWPGGLIVFDIRTEAMTPLAEAGATLADSIADVAAADIVSVTVLDDEQVREVVDELAQRVKPGTVIAIHSTISDTTAVELAQQLEPQGIHVVDAPSAVAAVLPRKASWPPWWAPSATSTSGSSPRSNSGRRWSSTLAHPGGNPDEAGPQHVDVHLLCCGV